MNDCPHLTQRVTVRAADAIDTAAPQFRRSPRTIRTYVATFALALTGSSLPYVVANVRDEINPAEVRATGTGLAVGSAAAAEPVSLDCVGSHHVGPHVDTDSSELTDGERQIVADLQTGVDAPVCVFDEGGLRCAGKNVGFEISGHADERVSTSIGNQALSEHRAQAVAGELQARGAMVALVEGVGASEPAPTPAPDHRTNAQRWKEDRRATVRLTCGGWTGQH